MSDNTAKRGRSSTVIATRVNWLGNRLVTTASATYGQIFFGFLPTPNVFGSAEVNSRTEGLNCEHSP